MYSFGGKDAPVVLFCCCYFAITVSYYTMYYIRSVKYTIDDSTVDNTLEFHVLVGFAYAYF